MALLTAPFMRPIIYSLEAILEKDLDPFEQFKYLLEEIVILGIPKGLQFTEPNLAYLSNCIFYDFTVKHTILIKGEQKSVEIRFGLSITRSKVIVTTRTIFDNRTEIYSSIDEFDSVYKDYVEISHLVKKKILHFVRF